MEGVVYQFPLRLKYFILQQKLFKQESKGLKKLQEVTETDKIQDPSAFQNKQNKLFGITPREAKLQRPDQKSHLEETKFCLASQKRFRPITWNEYV